jgi:hypothetical protein
VAGQVDDVLDVGGQLFGVRCEAVQPPPVRHWAIRIGQGVAQCRERGAEASIVPLVGLERLAFAGRCSNEQSADLAGHGDVRAYQARVADPVGGSGVPVLDWRVSPR